MLAAGYLFNSYVNSSIKTSTEQSQLQFSVLMASERIRDIARFSKNVQILQNNNNVPGQMGPTYTEAIYAQNGSLVHYKDGAASNILGSYPGGDITLQVTFNKTDKTFLWYTVSGVTTGGQSYAIEKEIQILNIGPADEIIKNFGDSSTTGLALMFAK